MKRDLKINFSTLEEIVSELHKFRSATEQMEQASTKMLRLLEQNESKAIEELKELYKDFNTELKTCQTELKDLETIFSGYTNEMQAVIRPLNKHQFMRVDRNDIWVNKVSIWNNCHLVFDRLNLRNDGWSLNFGASQEEKHREEQNFKNLTRIWDELVPRFKRKLEADLDALDRIYNRKIIPFENKDDEYEAKAIRLYYKYTNTWEGLRTDISDTFEDIGDLLHGALDGIVDLVVGLIGLVTGVISYAASAIVVGIYPVNTTPKWAEDNFEGGNSVLGAIVNDPLMIVEGFAQQASDAYEEEGAGYVIGYTAGQFLGMKGLDKLAKVGTAKILGMTTETLELSNLLKTVTELDDALAAVEKLSYSGLDESIIKTLLNNIDRGNLSVADKVSVKAALINKAISESAVLPDLQIVSDASFVDEVTGRIKWPPQDGFAVDETGNAIKEIINPTKESLFDRYGPPNGRFVSPEVSNESFEYARRSLPYLENPAAYHEYEITRNFDELSDAIKNCPDKALKNDINNYLNKYNLTLDDLKTYEGEIAPAFNEVGGGTQWQLPLPIDLLERLGFIDEL